MAIRGVHHLVLLVDDVPAAEAFYRELFDADVLFREGSLDGDPGTVPEDVPWDEALAAGVTPYMSFLGRDEFCFALASADGDGDGDGRAAAGSVDHVALAVDDATFEAVTDRAGELGCEVERNAAHHRTFEDRFGMEWELNAKPRPPGPAFDALDL